MASGDGGDVIAKIQEKCGNNRKRKRSRYESQTPTAAAERFMAVVPDDVLLEILMRLPSGRFVIRSSAVCKRWYALILGNNDNFGQRFIQFHGRKQSPNWEHSTLFNCAYTPKGEQPVYYQLPCTKLTNLRPYCLRFMPANSGIRASCRELLLLSSDVGQYYICNSLTRKWLTLPKFSPRVFEKTLGSWGFALVCHPQDNPESGSYRFRVVLLAATYFREVSHVYGCIFNIFDSDTGLWTEKVVWLNYELPREGKTNNRWRKLLQVVHTSNGILHWLDGTEGIYFVAAFDPFTSELRLIPLPSRVFRHIRPHFVKYRVRIGVVGGRLRVSLMNEISNVRFRMNIWELDGTDDSWTLVHDFYLDVSDGMAESLVIVLSFDPHDGDVIFIVHGKKIRRYEISQNKEKKFCEFPYCWESMDDERKRKSVSSILNVFTLVHPLWPTPLPLLAAPT